MLLPSGCQAWKKTRRAEQTPGRLQEFDSILVNLNPLLFNLKFLVVIRKKCVHLGNGGETTPAYPVSDTLNVLLSFG